MCSGVPMDEMAHGGLIVMKRVPFSTCTRNKTCIHSQGNTEGRAVKQTKKWERVLKEKSENHSTLQNLMLGASDSNKLGLIDNRMTHTHSNK